MIREVQNSHYWTDLEMMINYFTIVPDFDRQYIITGLQNMRTLGYRIVKSKSKNIKVVKKLKKTSLNSDNSNG